MTRRTLAPTLGAVLGAIAAIAPTTAVADGLPLPGVIAPKGGVALPNGSARYVASAHHGTTTVRALGNHGQLRGSRNMPGTFTIPAVALDGSPGGLSADGSALVLIRPRKSFPQASTHLLILGKQAELRVRDRLTLHGDFSFDAISPDGSRLYLIQYLSAQDPTRYAVRAYDVPTGRLLQRPIVDPDEHGDDMRGYPMTRVMSPDGRWAYTLYTGGGEHPRPFVHALDTSMGHAVCIDLPAYAALRNLYESHLNVSADGHLVTLNYRHEPTAVIDTQTFQVSRPPRPGEVSDSGGTNSGELWRLLAPIGVVALLGGGALFLILRRGRDHLAAGDA